MPDCHLLVLADYHFEVWRRQETTSIIFSLSELDSIALPQRQPLPLDPNSIGLLIDVFIDHHRSSEHQRAALALSCHQAANLEHENKPGPAVTRKAIPEAIDDYLKQHLGEAVSMQDLRQYFQCSSTHLCQQMRQAGKPSPIRRLAELRLREARKLLLKNELAISQVAAMVGIPRLAAFSHFFKKYSGKSPTEFRRDANWLI